MERGWLQSLFGTYNIFLYKYKKVFLLLFGPHRRHGGYYAG